MNSLEKQVVIVPKGAVTEGKESRNTLVELLVRAGYQKVVDGFASKKNRNDQVEDGEFIFRAVKGAGAVASQLELFNKQPIGILMGSDVLGEADLQARKVGIQSDIGRLLTLNEGPCSLRFLVPQEQAVESSGDMSGRVIFSKYPRLAERTLQITGQETFVRRVEGADTRVQEFRNRRRRVGAFEIVGSGDTARANKLQIVGNEYQYPTGEELGVPYLDLSRIQTDLFVTNISRVGGESRTRLRELGLALESARTSNLRVPIIMNVPVAKLPDFASLGMKGPSEITLLGNDQYRALQILVRPEEINSIRPRLMELGAEDVGFGDPVKVERGTEKSEVLRVLPFGESQNIEALSPPTYDAEIAEWLSNLELTIADRALNPDEKSRTTKALRLGTEYCVSRFVVEIAELSEAVRRSDDIGVVEEAGQCVYWFLVALRSKGLTLKDVVNTEKYEDVQQVLQELVRSLRESIDSADAQETTGTSSFLSSGVDGAAISIIDQSLRFSTAIRKETRDEAIVQARKSFASLVTLVELAGVTFDAVMEREQSGG